MKLALALLVLTACVEGEDDDEGGAATVSDARCASGTRWAGGNSESPLMHPGGDCIGCHDSGEGPNFVVAGTVHTNVDEPDDCFGVPGVTISLTDANGQALELTSNAAGNFYTRAALTMPISVTLSFEGRERVMGLMPPVGACGSCHTETGLNNAPGRIMAP